MEEGLFKTLRRKLLQQKSSFDNNYLAPPLPIQEYNSISYSTPKITRSFHDLRILEDEPESARGGQLVLTGFTLYQLIQEHFPTLIQDKTVHLRTYPLCSSGKELVDWIILNASVPRSRNMVIGMWQALMDAEVIENVNGLPQFKDEAQVLYRFTVSASECSPRGSLCSTASLFRRDNMKKVQSMESLFSTGSTDSITAQLDECFDVLEQCAPESLTYAAFIKSSNERTEEDIMIIFEELLHVKAFSQLSHAVKKELASCIHFDSYTNKTGHQLFRQGDLGTSWFIILRGSVNVIVNGKGIVCTLHEGDDFGKLALVNDAPRAATIELCEDHCSFLRIDKDDFNRILKAVEANTVRLQEHGRDVLILEKGRDSEYSVAAGTPEKMLEHLMDVAMKDVAMKDDYDNSFIYEFFLTHATFISVEEICNILLGTYKGTWLGRGDTDTQIIVVSEDAHEQTDFGSFGRSEKQQRESTKKKIVNLVIKWIRVMGQSIVTDTHFSKLFKDMTALLTKDKLNKSLDALNIALMDSYLQRRGTPRAERRDLQHSKQKVFTQTLFRKSTGSAMSYLPPVPGVVATDKEDVTVYSVDGKKVTISATLQTPAEELLRIVAKDFQQDPIALDLAEVTSSGEFSIIRSGVVSVPGTLKLNSRLFVLPKGYSGKVRTLPDQDSFPMNGTSRILLETAKDIAYHLTLYDFELLHNVSRTEYVYLVFGRHKFGKITTNLDTLLRRFNEVQFWVVTEICRTEDIQTRARYICKFIKIASYCKACNNLNSFFAIVLGLVNVSVSRLHSTWEKVPGKLKKKLETFERLIDPSMNHRALRVYQSNIKKPVIPFLPLVMKDCAFIHEGNDTFVKENLVNFDKLRMFSLRIHTIEEMKKGTLDETIITATLRTPHIRKFIKTLPVVNNQTTLHLKSKSLE